MNDFFLFFLLNIFIVFSFSTQITLCPTLKDQILNPTPAVTAACGQKGWTARARYRMKRAAKSLEEWLEKTKTAVLEMVSGVYNTVQERMAVEKSVEVIMYLITGACKEAKDGDELAQSLLQKILPFAGHDALTPSSPKWQRKGHQCTVCSKHFGRVKDRR